MCKKLLILSSFVLVFGLVSSAIAQPTGEILFEYWYDIGGTAIADLTGQAAYPDNPDDGELRASFDSFVDGPDNYGLRAHGYLYPPEDGDYTFWIAGDDYQDLYLSTDDDPANAVLLAQVLGWTNHLQWDKYPEQQSAPVTLVGGGKYYIEALMKEGGGGDSCAAGWTGPGIGEEITVIDGAYLSPAAWSPGLMKARNPVPADGAVDADVAMLEWTAGALSASHVVYLNGDLLAETDMTLAAAALEPGMAYTWQVNEVQADGTVIEGDVWSFTTLPLEAHFPSPEDGAEDVESATLTWTVGKNTIINDVYFGTDADLVAAGDPSTFKGKLMVASYDPGALELFTTYYWKVDEFSPTGTVPGPVWSFSTPKEVIILSGEQALSYDNSVEPFVSELALDVPADMTAEGAVSDLTLTFQGGAGNLSIDEATGTYDITGEGADVWGGSDAFHYVYMNLTGDGEITARVVSNGTGSNAWAKGGVMIRETNAADSKHMIMALTGGEGGGIAFQGRAETAGNSSGFHGDVTAAPPTWVKLTRVGNDITGSYSEDGVEWTQFTDTSPDAGAFAITNPQPVEMAETVLVGLFVTSHADGENRTFTFDNVDIQGNVDGVLVSEDIASVSGNSPAPIYVALEDAAGNVASIAHPYAAATMITAQRGWRIPLSEFAGVDVTAAAKLYVGVGDGEPGGAGAITVSNIRVVKGISAGNIIWVTGGYDDNADGVSDDLEWVDILTAEGYAVDNSDSYIELDDAKIAALNAADLIIVSRNSNSGDYDDGDEIAQWNAITTPMINSSTHIIRSSRWKWLDSTSILSLTPTMVLADGTEIPGINADVGPGSFMDSDPGNGVVLATGDGLPFIIEWEAGVEFYDGAGEVAGGPRVFFVAGTQETAPEVGRGEMNLAPEALAIFLAAVEDYIPAKLSDVTQPSDIVQGVPNDGLMDGDDFGWPGAETPDLAIDNDTGKKFLHFKGEDEPTGIRVTPLDGPSIVTGLTLTTANDATERDPVTFELSGSNEGIDGPYELIAAGDIVDFAGEAAWPRFTMNATPIMFDNDVAYAHYQLMFPTVRDPGSANSMQIGEVELLGVPAPKPADVTASGDVVKGVPDELRDGSVAGWPDGEYPGLAVDDDVSTKFLHFKGEVEPTGIQVSPASGPSIVTGLTLTTANDSPERDPISFELSGSNEGIDGPYELIAAGDIIDFALEAAYPRFRMNATPIAFDNDVVYAHYQLMFPTVRDAGSANSMQIAEVELLGFTVTPPLIASVVRSGGVSGDRDPIGAYDGSTQPLATEAGGLKDGNMVFSDRTYPWSGIPAEYEGSEYIRTFNSDKNGGTVDVTYEVTISRAAIVWLSVDDRIPAEWDAGGAITSPQDAADYVTAAIGPAGTFTDSGLDIFVHENDTTDRQMSVYAAVLPAGTYVFGSMDSGKNFYTIGAIE